MVIAFLVLPTRTFKEIFWNLYKLCEQIIYIYMWHTMITVDASFYKEFFKKMWVSCSICGGCSKTACPY